MKFNLVKKGLYRSDCQQYEVVRSVLVLQVWTCRNVLTDQIVAKAHTITEIRKRMDEKYYFSLDRSGET